MLKSRMRLIGKVHSHCILYHNFCLLHGSTHQKCVVQKLTVLPTKDQLSCQKIDGHFRFGNDRALFTSNFVLHYSYTIMSLDSIFFA